MRLVVTYGSNGVGVELVEGYEGEFPRRLVTMALMEVLKLKATLPE